MSRCVPQIRKLFHGHPDLINDFHTFLPLNPHSQPSTVSTVSTVSPAPSNPSLHSAPAAAASLYAPYSRLHVMSPPSFPAPAKTPAKTPAALPEKPASSDQDAADFAALRASAGLSGFEHFLRICALFADVALSHDFDVQKVISLAEFLALCESLFRHKPNVLQQITSLLLRSGVPRDLVESARFLEW